MSYEFFSSVLISIYFSLMHQENFSLQKINIAFQKCFHTVQINVQIEVLCCILPEFKERLYYPICN